MWVCNQDARYHFRDISQKAGFSFITYGLLVSQATKAGLSTSSGHPAPKLLPHRFFFGVCQVMPPRSSHKATLRLAFATEVSLHLKEWV